MSTIDFFGKDLLCTYFFNTPRYLLIGYIHMHVTGLHALNSSTKCMTRCDTMSQNDGGMHALNNHNVLDVYCYNQAISMGLITFKHIFLEIMLRQIIATCGAG